MNPTITIELDELRAMFEDAAKIAVAAYIREQKPADDRISQNKAYALFGESRVKRWLKHRQIRPVREGDAKNSTRYYSLSELRTLEATDKALFIINRRRKAV